MSWVGRRDGKCLFDLDLPGLVIPACSELAAIVDTAVLGDFGVAEYAKYIAQGFQLLELGFVVFHRQISRLIWGWWIKYGSCAHI